MQNEDVLADIRFGERIAKYGRTILNQFAELDLLKRTNASLAARVTELETENAALKAALVPD
jgi:hypothetical protein